jgi:hypothetical protein
MTFIIALAIGLMLGLALVIVIELEAIRGCLIEIKKKLETITKRR